MKLPKIVEEKIRELQNLCLTDKFNEHGYSIYRKNRKYYIQKDQGSSALTVSNFSNLNEKNIDIVLNPTHIYLLHSHPFQRTPSPSLLDLETAERFCNFYKNSTVICILVTATSYIIYCYCKKSFIKKKCKICKKIFYTKTQKEICPECEL